MKKIEHNIVRPEDDPELFAARLEFCKAFGINVEKMEEHRLAGFSAFGVLVRLKKRVFVKRDRSRDAAFGILQPMIVRQNPEGTTLRHLVKNKAGYIYSTQSPITPSFIETNFLASLPSILKYTQGPDCHLQGVMRLIITPKLAAFFSKGQLNVSLTVSAINDCEKESPGVFEQGWMTHIPSPLGRYFPAAATL